MKFTKKTIIILIIVVVAAFAVYSALKPKGPAYKTQAATKGNIVQEVSETGTVKKGDTVNLSFQNSGTINKIYVKKGDRVEAGQLLAELDTAQLEVQLRQAQANADLYSMQRNKLVNGASEEDIRLAQTSVSNAQAALDDANQGLADAKDGADQRMSNLYETAADVLTSAHAKAVNAGNAASLLQRTYFTPQSDDSIRVVEASREITEASTDIGYDGNYRQSLQNAADELSRIAQYLAEIRAICEKKAWRDIVDQTDKDDIDTQRDYIIAALTSVNTAAQNIDLQKVANDGSINAAQSAVTAAQGALQSAREQLSKVTARPRAEDVGALDAQMAQAQAQVDLLKLQIGNSRLEAPAAGQVAEINFREGEAVQSILASGAVLILIPEDPYVVEADIYEEDIVKVNIGDSVKIVPASNADETYMGKVVSIDPSSNVVNGVVYYTVRIGFDELPENIKVGMSADITIETESADNVILISEGALKKDEQGYYVQIVKNGKITETRIKTGIKSKGQVQIISGISEGDEVIID